MAPELPSREAAVRTLVAALDDAVLARALVMADISAITEEARAIGFVR